MPLGLFRRVRLFAWLLPRRRGGHRRVRGAAQAPAVGRPGQAGTRPGPGPRPVPRLAPPAPRPGSPAASRLNGPAVPGGGAGRGNGTATRSQPGVAAGNARAAVRTVQAGRDRIGPAQRRAATRQPRTAASRPWYEQRALNRAAPGMRDCGCLEPILVREWTADASPEPATVAAVNRLAELPQLIKERLAAGLDAIHVGAGGVPDLDHMRDLKGVLLPSGRATWDACAGAYGDKKIIVGSRPSPTPDVMCHEIGHALDDLDGTAGRWQSDSADFCHLYQRCMSRMASAFHRQGGPLGRREFFADSFAAIASGQRPALVEMLSGDTRAALDVMLYFNVRYGI
jgi:hypothetical protein